ncbi:ankyrin repeat-containing domain protein [Aspergillus oleicola]
MRVPLEILRLIFQDIVHILPTKEVLKARLVNSLFADELLPLYLARLGYASIDELALRRWWKFPCKRDFIERRIKEHDRTPCVFSTWVHDILAIPSNRDLALTETDRIVAQVVDTIIYSQRSPSLLFDPKLPTQITHYYTYGDGPQNMHFESHEDSFFTTQLCSAIIHNDVVEVTRLLDYPCDRNPSALDLITTGSRRLCVAPMDVALKVGTKEIIRLLICRGVRLDSTSGTNYYYSGCSFLSIAATHGNIGAAEALLEALTSRTASITELEEGSGINADSITGVLRSAIRAGQLQAAELLENYIDPSDEGFQEMLETDFFPMLLTQAIESGRLEFVNWCLDRPYARVFSSERQQLYGRLPHKGPLWVAIHDCPAEARPAIVKQLLEYGFAPNDPRPGMNQTLLQCAVERDDLEVARLLVQHEVDVNVCGTGIRGDRHKPPLASAVEGSKANDMVRLLLDAGARKTWRWRGKEYVLSTNEKAIWHIEAILSELGFEDQVVGEEYTGFYIVVNE